MCTVFEKSNSKDLKELLKVTLRPKLLSRLAKLEVIAHSVVIYNHLLVAASLLLNHEI